MPNSTGIRKSPERPPRLVPADSTRFRAAAIGLAASGVEDDHSPAAMNPETSQRKTILTGDVGGTKTVVALYDAVPGQLELRREEVFKSDAHRSLEEVLEKFRSQVPREKVDAACFGVAGTVADGVANLTNLSWQVDAAKLARDCDLPRVHLLNDLEAMAYGMLGLGEDELTVLNPGLQPRRDGNIAVLAAGTGLGEAMLIWDGARHSAVATEGGHANFAPRGEDEIELLRFLQQQHGTYVSYEHILSGPGLFNIYRFLRQKSGESEPAWLAEGLRSEDPSALIGSAGVEERDPVCARAVEMFASIYGSEAGNMALRCLAMGGVMVGGGIAPKLLPVLRRSGVTEAFFDKGKYSEMMRGIRLVVATNPRIPLLGAAEFARAALELD